MTSRSMCRTQLGFSLTSLMLYVLCAVTTKQLFGTEDRRQKDNRQIGAMTFTAAEIARKYPYMASLRLADDSCDQSTLHFCTGSIFDTTTGGKRWLLTAAHCLENVQARIDMLNAKQPQCDFRLTVDVGRADGAQQNIGYESVRMEGWQNHEGYVHSTMQNDIAIAWTFDELSVKPVTLQSTPYCGKQPQLKLLSYEGFHFELSYKDLNFVPLSTCDGLMKSHADDVSFVKEGMQCALQNTGIAIGNLSFGAPLIQDMKQVGILSWHYKNTTKPVGFTEVAHYYHWIAVAQAKGDNEYVCHNNCAISLSLRNDGYCNCPECEDELEWDCHSCSDGCPPDCFHYAKCN